MKATNVGVNLNKNNNFRFFLREYVAAKYEGLPENLRRVILHPHHQLAMQHGKKQG